MSTDDGQLASRPMAKRGDLLRSLMLLDQIDRIDIKIRGHTQFHPALSVGLSHRPVIRLPNVVNQYRITPTARHGTARPGQVDRCGLLTLGGSLGG